MNSYLVEDHDRRCSGQYPPAELGHCCARVSRGGHPQAVLSRIRRPPPAPLQQGVPTGPRSRHTGLRDDGGHRGDPRDRRPAPGDLRCTFQAASNTEENCHVRRRRVRLPRVPAPAPEKHRLGVPCVVIAAAQLKADAGCHHREHRPAQYAGLAAPRVRRAEFGYQPPRPELRWAAAGGRARRRSTSGG